MSDEVYRQGYATLLASEHGDSRLVITSYSCPNPKCRKLTIYAGLWPYTHKGSNIVFGKQIQKWNLLPESEAKPQPDYIPQAIRDDYAEACRIRDLSAKASATLSRRCLQGMIRDFWSIKKRNLAQAIQALKPRVDIVTWKAIDAVRQVGNIGAHMEKNIDLIVEVEPDEAGLLIGLIERLFVEWYVAKHLREESMGALAALADEKALARKGQLALPKPTETET